MIRSNAVPSARFYSALFAFFVFGTLFPTLRALLIGSQTSEGVYEILLASLFDVASVVILLYSAYSIVAHRYYLRFNLFDWIVSAFILSNVVVGALLCDDRIICLYGFRMTYLPALFYFALRFNDDSRKISMTLLHALYTWFLIIGVVGILFYFFFYDEMLFMIQKVGGVVNTYFITRMTSVFWSPVLFATFMTVAFLFFYNRLLETKKKWYYLALVILWVCILTSVTRGALIILVFGILIQTLYFKAFKQFLWTGLLMVSLFFVVSAYIGSPLKFIDWIVTSSVETVGMESKVTRVELWKEAFSDFKERPFGYGLGRAGHVAARFFEKGSKMASVSSTDGWFLKLAGETGILGLVSYFTLACAFLLIVWRRLMRSKDYLLFFLFTFFLVVNIQCIVSNVIDFYLFSNLYWLSIGMAIGLKEGGDD